VSGPIHVARLTLGEQVGDSATRNMVTSVCDAIGGILTVVSPQCPAPPAYHSVYGVQWGAVPPEPVTPGDTGVGAGAAGPESDSGPTDPFRHISPFRCVQVCPSGLKLSRSWC
jgi:hypothetical protein